MYDIQCLAQVCPVHDQRDVGGGRALCTGDHTDSVASERAEEFAALRIKELRDDISQRWEKEIFKYLPEDKNLKILDIGTGSGYFALLLSQMGYHVTGIDLTEKMIEEAKKTAKVLGSDAQFLVMDAEEHNP